MSYLILVINPGSTSTKVALYEDENELFNSNCPHSAVELEGYDHLYDQFEMRHAVVLAEMEKCGYRLEALSAVVGRGGMLPPIKAGGYLVNDSMKSLIRGEQVEPHASNLGAVIADSIAAPLGIPAYIYDAVSADEMDELAHITGLPEVYRHSFCHVLNSRAVSREYARRVGKRYEDINVLVAHLGGGISISAHRKGRIIDSLADDNGPFAPERSGSLPLLSIIELCFSGKYTKKEMKRKVRGMGGLKALLGTSDCREIERRIVQGDEKAKLIYDAQVYQIAKGIGLLSPMFKGELDAIILTGGLAFSSYITEETKAYVGFIAPVIVIPGEFEMEALAKGAYRILTGQEEAREFRV